MRHLSQGRKLSRNTSHRRALLRNLATNLLEYEQIVTTDAKAKELRRVAEKMITLGKKGDLAARRRAGAFLTKKEIVKSLFETIAPRYKDKNGGYTRIMKMGFRVGDRAPISLIELIPDEKTRQEKLKTKRDLKKKSEEVKAKKAQEEQQQGSPVAA